jgi:hypothetical protein
MQAAIGLPAVLPVAARGSRLAARRRSIVAAGTRRLAGGVVHAAPTGAVEVDYSSDVSYVLSLPHSLSPSLCLGLN